MWSGVDTVLKLNIELLTNAFSIERVTFLFSRQDQVKNRWRFVWRDLYGKDFEKVVVMNYYRGGSFAEIGQISDPDFLKGEIINSKTRIEVPVLPGEVSVIIFYAEPVPHLRSH